MICTKDTDRDFFARDAPDMGCQSGRDVMGSFLPLVKHMHIIIQMLRMHNKILDTP